MWNFGGWAASLGADSVGGSSDNNTSTSAHVLVCLSGPPQRRVTNRQRLRESVSTTTRASECAESFLMWNAPTRR